MPRYGYKEEEAFDWENRFGSGKFITYCRFDDKLCTKENCDDCSRNGNQNDIDPIDQYIKDHSF